MQATGGWEQSQLKKLKSEKLKNREKKTGGEKTLRKSHTHTDCRRDFTVRDCGSGTASVCGLTFFKGGAPLANGLVVHLLCKLNFGLCGQKSHDD